MAKHASTLEVDGHPVKVSSLDKVLYPAARFTKGQVLDYYARVSPVIIPHVKGRALTLKRYPNGVEGAFFYEKECPTYRPSWMNTISVARTSKPGKLNYCQIENAAALIWVANLASLEIHILLSKSNGMQRPTAMAFDLDPGPGTDILDCAWVATKMREMFANLGLQSFPKTSGKKGIHLYVPLNTAVTFEQTKQFAHQVALALEQAYPDKIVSKMAKELRQGKVLVDWSQNDDFKTTVAAYSLRATPMPQVSTPLTWDELDSAMGKKDRKAFVFSPAQVLARIAKHGDLFEPVLTLKQKLPVAGVHPPVGAKQLQKYRSMRDFKVTPEPGGGKPSPKGKEIFVIQKHAASHLHYDFRLEAEGVLKSWAVPKGPSTQLGVKRLAMMTEDHPMDYANFEGTIPRGEYGGGTVMVWDTGTYVNLTQKNGKLVPQAAGIAKGHIDFWLQGKKLNGGWSLIRTGAREERKWLLVKMDDPGVNFPPDPVAESPDSVLTARSVEEIAGDKKSKVWHSNLVR